MDPVTVALGGLAMTSLITYGRDRKELNGTVERVKKIDQKLDEHIREEKTDMIEMHEDIKEISTKVDLLISGKIKDK